jgi:hypothetical protein
MVVFYWGHILGHHLQLARHPQVNHQGAVAEFYQYVLSPAMYTKDSFTAKNPIDAVRHWPAQTPLAHHYLPYALTLDQGADATYGSLNFG